MTIFCSSLRRSDTGWIQVFILSLTQSGKSSSRGRISVKFIISRQLPFVFRRRVLSSTLLYGKISPDSSVTFSLLKLRIYHNQSLFLLYGHKSIVSFLSCSSERCIFFKRFNNSSWRGCPSVIRYKASTLIRRSYLYRSRLSG